MGSVSGVPSIPIVLGDGETVDDDEDCFARWVHQVRRLNDIDDLRASASEVDVRLERRLRFDFAKLKAKRRLPSVCRPKSLRPQTSHTSATAADAASGRQLHSDNDPPAPLPIGGKRKWAEHASSGKSDDPDLHLKKYPRRQGNPAVRGSQTPKSSQKGVAPATLPDTGYGLDVDVASGFSPRESGDSHGHPATLGDVYTTQEAFEEVRQQLAAAVSTIDDLKEEMNSLRACLQRSEDDYHYLRSSVKRNREHMDQFGAPQLIVDYVQTSNVRLSRLEGQFEVLMRMQLPNVAPPPTQYGMQLPNVAPPPTYYGMQNPNVVPPQTQYGMQPPNVAPPPTQHGTQAPPNPRGPDPGMA